MAKKEPLVAYIYYARNNDGLRNGSFIRTSVYGPSDTFTAQFMNGDNMGEVRDIPEDFDLVDTKLAESLIPGCCRLPKTRRGKS